MRNDDLLNNRDELANVRSRRESADAQSSQEPSVTQSQRETAEQSSRRPAPPLDYHASEPRETPAQHSRPQRPRNRHTVLKVLLALFVGYLAVSFAMNVAGLAALTVGLVSCASSCSDSPIGDTEQTAQFIHDHQTNERDLATFDALRGAIEAVYEQRSATNEAQTDSPQPVTVDELRAMVAAGQWPDVSAGYGDVGSATNPQLWVRIAELAQNHIQEVTGQRWDVVDLAYPFPDNGPIPVPPTRDESDTVQVLLVCQSGPDKGLLATVDYWRWEQPARFEDQVQTARDQRDQSTQLDQAIVQANLVGDRQYVLDGTDLYIWEQGPDDPLRTDHQSFCDIVTQLSNLSGGYADVTLLAADTPVRLAYAPLSYDYPNDRDTQQVSLETCKQALANGRRVFYFDAAFGDQLLAGWCSSQTECTPDTLRGTLISGSQTGYLDTWYQPGEDASWDDALADATSASLGLDDPQHLIAISSTEHNSRGDTIVRAWVVVPDDAVPLTRDEFHTAFVKLADDVWESCVPKPDGDTESSLYLRLYVVDEQTLAQGEQALTFAELREKAQQDIASLGTCQFDVLLAAYPSICQWSSDDEPVHYDCEAWDVDGTVARSRDWDSE